MSKKQLSTEVDLAQTTIPELEVNPSLLDKELSISFSLTSPVIQEYPFGNESLYRDCISTVMRNDGWSVQTEVRNEYGIADLVARRGKEIWVIEAKLFSDNNSLAHACGQLLFYTSALPFTKRIVATPDRLPSFLLYKVLRLNDIEPFEFTDYYFSTKCLFDKESKIKKHISVIESSMIALQELVAFLIDAEPIDDADTMDRWRALSQMLKNGAEAIDYFIGDAKPRLAA